MSRSIGSQQEDYAATYLRSLGWKIIDRNIHLRFGEIDILADAGNAIVLVEVKAKKGNSQGLAVEMLTPQKQRTLALLAKIVQAEYNKPVRIDVVTIDGYATEHPNLVHYPFAVGEM